MVIRLRRPFPWLARLKLSASLSGFDVLDERSPLVPGEHEDRSLSVLGVTDGSAVGQVGYLHAVAVAVD
jgi:hypothetical protein